MYSIKYTTYEEKHPRILRPISFILDILDYLGYFKFIKYSRIYLLLGCLAYDIIYNDMVLSTIYYCGMLLSLYYLLIHAKKRKLENVNIIILKIIRLCMQMKLNTLTI